MNVEDQEEVSFWTAWCTEVLYAPFPQILNIKNGPITFLFTSVQIRYFRTVLIYSLCFLEIWSKRKFTCYFILKKIMYNLMRKIYEWNWPFSLVFFSFLFFRSVSSIIFSLSFSYFKNIKSFIKSIFSS